MKKVIVIAGATGSGKTDLSIKIAKKINAEIINADAVQVYKELNIGSAKIKKEEMEDVKHHLLSIASIEKRYTVYDYQKDARDKINKIPISILVGGTGFYIKAALFDYNFSSNTFKNYEELTNEEIYEKIIAVDKNIKIDFKNRHRLISALNMIDSGELRSNKNRGNKPLYDILIIYLDLNRDALEEKLKLRLEKQFKEGFLEEALLYKNYNLNIIGYRELNEYFDQKINLKEAKDKIILKSLQYAKRQKTWFKNQMNILIFDALDKKLHEKVINKIKKFLEIK